MSRRRPGLAGTLCLTAALAACGTDVAVVRSQRPRETAPVVTETDRAALLASNASFALDLYQALRADPSNDGSNLFFSPYSISVVLAMTAAGARGQTETELWSALRHTLPADRVHPALNWVDLQVASRTRSASAREPLRLSVANSLWGQADLGFQGEFLDLLAVHYDAGMQLVDFKKSPAQSARAINDWVADKTEQKIQDLMGPDAISASTRLVLVNAIYFKATWLGEFLPPNTRGDSFRRRDGSTVPVEMMARIGDYPYAETDLYQAIDLPYDGGDLSMLVVLPREGRFEAFEAGLGREALSALVQRLSPATVRLQMPKFTYRPDGFSLTPALKSLGMRTAFEDAADLSGITVEEPLKISDCVHKAFIAVDERGTEAAAATGVVVVPVSAPPEPRVTMRIDRPFVLAIRDRPTGTLLFIGRILDPKQ